MKKKTLAIAAFIAVLLAALIVAMHTLDLPEAIRRLHGMP